MSECAMTAEGERESTPMSGTDESNYVSFEGDGLHWMRGARIQSAAERDESYVFPPREVFFTDEGSPSRTVQDGSDVAPSPDWRGRILTQNRNVASGPSSSR